MALLPSIKIFVCHVAVAHLHVLLKQFLMRISFMLSFLLAIHFLLAVLIIGLVLIQKHESDGILGTGGGGAGKIFSVRGQANLLTRSTAVLMTLFFINCLVMAKMVKHAPQQGSLIDKDAKESVPVTSENENGNVGKTSGNTANGAPVTPSVPAAPTKVPTSAPTQRK